MGATLSDLAQGPAADVPEERSRSAATLLMTLLGDYWWANDRYIPSGALVALLAEFDVQGAAGRAALSRLTRNGYLEGVKEGRNTSYRLAPPVEALGRETARDLLSVGAGPVDWDGQWTCVAFSVPETDRQRRRALRRRLRALRLGPLFDGFWITPAAPLDEITQALDDLGIADAAVLRVTPVARTRGIDLPSAWDLDGLRAGYEGMLARLAAIEPRMAGGDVGAAEALVMRTGLARRWIGLVARDPRLPDATLPDGWPLREARARFVAVYDALGPLAELRVRQIVGAHGEEAARIPRAHRVADLL
ncbi:MAG TPA: PaaX family transcriptional regulator C-terminal domain-containing protein [Acidimicrobiales bacterium]|nr:PaaX family transcriptional regulator C-terminal domain-containing protein [Acidimicrobiales bacterium]